MNPNNCSTCDYKWSPDGGHCYMFRKEPTNVCGQHTGRKVAAADLIGRSFYVPSCIIEDDTLDSVIAGMEGDNGATT